MQLEEKQVTAEFILEKFATKCLGHLIIGQKQMLSTLSEIRLEKTNPKLELVSKPKTQK